MRGRRIGILLRLYKNGGRIAVPYGKAVSAHLYKHRPAKGCAAQHAYMRAGSQPELAQPVPGAVAFFNGQYGALLPGAKRTKADRA